MDTSVMSKSSRVFKTGTNNVDHCRA